MKKFFTLLAVSAALCSASATELTLATPNGTILPDGDVLFNTPNPIYLEDGEIAIYGTVTLTPDQAATVDVSITLVSGVEQYGFCIENCVPLAVGQTMQRQSIISPASPLKITVEPMMFDDPWTTSVIRTFVGDVTVKEGSQILKSFSIIISNDENASVKSVVADQDGFSVSGRYIYWNQNEAPGYLTVYTVDGRVVEQHQLSTTSGSVALMLPPGLYIWSTPSKSGKILLRD